MDATGGATVAPGEGSIARIVIEANDNAAGIVGLSPLSRSAVVSEGEQAVLVVERRTSFLGRVAVSWQISGSDDVTQEFVNASGVVAIEDVRICGPTVGALCMLCDVFHQITMFKPSICRVPVLPIF